MKLSRKHVLMVVIAVLIGIPVLGVVMLTAQNSQRRGLNTMQLAPSMGQAGMMAEDVAVSEMGRQAGYGGEMMAKSVSSTLMPVPPGFYSEGFTPGVDRVIVKNADMSLVVDDTRQAVSQVAAIATKEGGTVTHSSVYENDIKTGQIFANMTLRVPVEKVDAVMAAVRQVATKVVSENLSAQDRTEQKVDLDAQLKNLRATETQLQTIMAQANTVEDTLKVQTELGNVRGQIERLQAQLDNLLGDAAMSIISVSMSTEEAELPIVDDSNRSIVQEIKLAIRDAVTLYRNLFVAGLRLVILGLPILVIGGVSYALWRKKKK